MSCGGTVSPRVMQMSRWGDIRHALQASHFNVAFINVWLSVIWLEHSVPGIDYQVDDGGDDGDDGHLHHYYSVSESVNEQSADWGVDYHCSANSIEWFRPESMAVPLDDLNGQRLKCKFLVKLINYSCTPHLHNSVLNGLLKVNVELVYRLLIHY